MPNARLRLRLHVENNVHQKIQYEADLLGQIASTNVRININRNVTYGLAAKQEKQPEFGALRKVEGREALTRELAVKYYA